MTRLYFDDMRCTGYAYDPVFKFEPLDPKQKCKQAENCERYLQRLSVGPRTPRQLAPSIDGCEYKIERVSGASEA